MYMRGGENAMNAKMVEKKKEFGKKKKQMLDNISNSLRDLSLLVGDYSYKTKDWGTFGDFYRMMGKGMEMFVKTGGASGDKYLLKILPLD